jgi:hypothetical protein
MTSITNNLSLWEAPALLPAIIHRSAWKGNSQKLACSKVQSFSFVRGSATSRYNARNTAAKEQIDGLFNSQLRGDGALR